MIQYITSTVAFGGLTEHVASLAGNLVEASLTVLQSVGVLANVPLAWQMHGPHVVFRHVIKEDDAFFSVRRQFGVNASCAALVLTDSLNVNATAASMAAGVHAYVPGDYPAQRLPALVHLAQALADVNNLLDKHKVVDHAKTILMSARHLSDDDAFHLLRAASMHNIQRLADVSRHIIQAARFADSVKRWGQLRMLSQRVVKITSLAVVTTRPSHDGSVERRLRAHRQKPESTDVKTLHEPSFWLLSNKSG